MKTELKVWAFFQDDDWVIPDGWKIVTATYENAILYVITEHAYTHEADRLLRKETA